MKAGARSGRPVGRWVCGVVCGACVALLGSITYDKGGSVPGSRMVSPTDSGGPKHGEGGDVCNDETGKRGWHSACGDGGSAVCHGGVEHVRMADNNCNRDGNPITEWGHSVRSTTKKTKKTAKNSGASKIESVRAPMRLCRISSDGSVLWCVSQK